MAANLERDPNFYCPQCGSSYFGTGPTNFLCGGVFGPGTIGRCKTCAFEWDRTDERAERRAFPRTAANGGCYCYAFSDGVKRCSAPPVATVVDNYQGDGVAWRACEEHARYVMECGRVGVAWDCDHKKPTPKLVTPAEPVKAVAPPPPKHCVACGAEDGFVLLRQVSSDPSAAVNPADPWYCADCAPEGHYRPTCVPTQAERERYQQRAERAVLCIRANRLGLTAPEVLRPARGWDARYAL